VFQWMAENYSTFLVAAFGRAIQCLAKIGDELYLEATSDGVRGHCRLNIICTKQTAI